jgi:acetylornithine deacetylase/succinyl-diaminopimelate desuccinylase-like protein
VTDGFSVAAALRAARGARSADLADLARWLAIPSISADPRAGPRLIAAADHLDRALTRAGARVHRVPTGGAPVVVGDVAGPAGGPVVLIYGHYDVQPPGPGWSVPPFAVVRRGGDLIARGANDDKGQLAMVIAALRAALAGGGVPGRVLVVAEGAEEIGSPGLDQVLAGLGRRVRPDVVLVCDTERAPDGIPAVTLSQRGRIDAEILVEVRGVPVHPGRLGGVVTDPSLVLADVLGGLRSAVATIPAAPATGRAGRAVLSVTRLAAGPVRGPVVGAIPVRARARIDVRLPPAVPAATAVDLIRSTLPAFRRPAGIRAGPARVDLVIRNGHQGKVFAPDARILRALDRACRASFGSPLRYRHSGGSLRAAVLLSESFESASAPVLLGLGPPNGAAHGPDERLDLAGWVCGVDLFIYLFAIFEEMLSPRPDDRVRIPH